MSRKPITALRVSDLDTAVRFYCEGMGYQLEWHQPGEAAQIVLGGALPLLLLPLEATAFKHWLHEAYQSDAPVTRRIYVQAPMPIEAYQALLQRRGLVPGEVTAAADGTKTMALTDPDGRPVEIFQEPPLSDAAILERYEKGPAALVEALACGAVGGAHAGGAGPRAVHRAALPDGLDRTLDMDLAGIATVREMLARMAMHAAGHTEQIRETRRIHQI